MLDNSAFSVNLAIERHPPLVTPQTRVTDAIVLMSQARSSCVVVVEKQKLIGIFTERDVVKLTASITETQPGSFAQRFGNEPIAAVMTGSLLTMQESELPDLGVMLDLLAQHQIRHLPIVNEQGHIVGIITHQSIREIIKPADWMKLRRVVEVMTTEVITAPGSASVHELAQLMSEFRVSCVVIVRDPIAGLKELSASSAFDPRLGIGHCTQDNLKPLSEKPVGIVTERDILQFQALELDPRVLNADRVMSTPLLLVRSTDSLWIAHQLMREHRVRRLVVADDGGTLQGIVTQTSLLRGCAPMEMDTAIAVLQRVVDERTGELKQANEHLRKEILERKQTETALRVSQARLAGILDSADDAIISVDETYCIQLFNQGAEKIFGYSAAEILGQPLDVLLPENLRPTHCQHLENFKTSPEIARKMGSRTQVFGRRKDGNNFPAEASISKLEVGSETILTVILRDITARVEAQAALQLQLDRERLMSAMRDRIRQSLNLQEILNTTVAEVRQFLKSDRVIVYRFDSDWSGKAVVESVGSDTKPILGITILDPCFGETHAALYKQGRIKATTDIYTAQMSDCHVNLLAQFQVRANLVVPILLNEELREKNDAKIPGSQLSLDNSQLWGLLIAHHCSATRQWHQWEMDFLKGLATQVAIAIQQSTLFEQLQAANQKLYRLASLDGLTQVANRRCFNEFLEQKWQEMAQQYSPLSLILCDIDFFKLYNDTYGHQAGDDCLQQVAAALRNGPKSPADLVARYGGEEFAIVLPNTDAESAVNLAENIRLTVAKLQIPNLNSPVSDYVTLSLGVASVIPLPDCSPAQLIAVADQALYQAKNKGRDRVVKGNLC